MPRQFSGTASLSSLSLLERSRVSRALDTQGAGRIEQGPGRTEQGPGRTEQGYGNPEQGPGRTEQGSGRTEQGSERTEQGSGAPKWLRAHLRSVLERPERHEAGESWRARDPE